MYMCVYRCAYIYRDVFVYAQLQGNQLVVLLSVADIVGPTSVMQMIVTLSTNVGNSVSSTLLAREHTQVCTGFAWSDRNTPGACVV